MKPKKIVCRTYTLDFYQSGVFRIHRGCGCKLKWSLIGELSSYNQSNQSTFVWCKRVETSSWRTFIWPAAVAWLLFWCQNRRFLKVQGMKVFFSFLLTIRLRKMYFFLIRTNKNSKSAFFLSAVFFRGCCQTSFGSLRISFQNLFPPYLSQIPATSTLVRGFFALASYSQVYRGWLSIILNSLLRLALGT